MKTKAIVEKQARENVKFELAKQIRTLLDEARKSYGSDWDEHDVETEICDLVFGEEG